VKSTTAGRPYPGSRSYEQQDRDWFFGRASDAVVLTQWWRDNRLTLVAGRAGRGKTSLLQAGVLPVLADEKVNILPVGQLSYGSSFPSAALPAHNPYTLALLRSWSPGETATRLAGLTVREFIRRLTRDGSIFAAIDLANELLTPAGPRRTHRRRFLSELKEAVAGEPRLHLLVAGREEPIGVVADALGNGARYQVTALTWQGALDAVSKPTAKAGRPFAAGAAERLVTDLQTSRILGVGGAERTISDERVEPALLEVTCAELWESLPLDAGQITTRDIRTYADVDAVLAKHCGTVIAQVADEHDVPAKRLRSWMLSTFVTELGTRGKAYEGATVTAGMPNALARALEDRHLLTARPESGARWYELLHDRLIEPLRQAVDVHPPPVSPQDQLRAAEHALTLGDLDLAERQTRDVLDYATHTDPLLHAAAWTLLGNLAFEREKPKEAETCYRAAARLYAAAEDNRAVAFQLAAVGQVLLARGNVREGLAELHAAVARLPSDLLLQTELAQALWQDNRGPAAVAILNDVLRMDGSHPVALQARGEILAFLGEPRKAILDLDRVAAQGRPSIRAARGLALAELGDQRGARQVIEDAVAEGRHNGLVLLYAARAFAIGGDSDAAHELARQAAHATDPPLSPSHQEAARLLASSGHG
jgi:tetratricopeptide (TPR) repeat protein